MTRRQRIDTAREIRLWTTGIITPLFMVLAASPEAREKAKELYEAGKEKARQAYNKLFKK